LRFNQSHPHAARTYSRLILALVALLLTLSSALPALPAHAQTPNLNFDDPESELLLREAQLIAFANAERQKEGLLPLRWNRNISEAARWFARDAVLTKITCGSTDSLGRGPGTRLRAFGYTNMLAYGEAVACGFTEPHAAVAAWMYEENARKAIMNPDAREAGAGYFYSQELSRGYVVFDVAVDPTFAPVVINNEALSTPSPNVTLTVHPQPSPAVAMKVSNSPDFAAVAWEPYAAQKAWALEAGEGWRTVYVLLRGADNQTQMLSDIIYLGDSIDCSEVSLAQATKIGTAFTASGLPPAASPSVRLSLDWSYDSSDPTFLVYRGPQLVDEDSTAIGGSALRLVSGERPGLARGILNTLPVNKLLTAYFRVKVSNNQGTAEVARLTVRADGQEFGPLVLKAEDFATADTYQEFSIDFAFPAPNATTQAEVQVERTGASDIVIDAVRFYGQPLSTRNPIVWSTGSTTFRGQGVLARTQSASGVGAPFYIAGAPVDAAAEMPGHVPALQTLPTQLTFKSQMGNVMPVNAAVAVCADWCANVTWQTSGHAPWLSVTQSYEGIIVHPNPAGLTQGVYDTTITISPSTSSGTDTAAGASPLTVSVRLLVDGAEAPKPLDPGEITTNIYLPVAINS
jgi:uncharacterized protein YkwD